MACLFGHKWNGCKCEKCGKTRDEGHQWQHIEEAGFDLCRLCLAQRPIKASKQGMGAVMDSAGNQAANPECRRLIAVLKSDSDWNARRDAAKTLAGYPNPESIDALIFAMKHDQNWPVRFNCADALGTIGDARAIDPLTEALADENNTVIQYAAKALGRIGGSQAIEGLLGVMRRYRDGDYTGVNGAIDALGSLGEAAVPRLLELADSDIKMHVMRALAKTGSPRAVETLIKEASDPQNTAYHRSLMADGIGQVSGNTAVEALLALLDTAKDEAVVKAVVRNLEVLGIGGDDLEKRKQAAQRASAQKLLDGLRAIKPGMREEDADRLVGGANFGMGANQVHETRFGSFQLLVNGGIVYDTLYVDVIAGKIEEYLKSGQ